jgi:hypothetical protein
LNTSLAAVLILSLTVGTAAQQPEKVNPQAAALADFQKRLDAYLQLRTELAKKLEPLSPTASAADLQARQQALAAALKTARAGARPGDLIPETVQEMIRKTVMADFLRRRPAEKRAAFQEVPEGPPPGINKTYPVEAALPTVPPLLLANLPQLPDNLQYRFFGRHIVILDGDVQIVVDYVLKALPAH